MADLKPAGLSVATAQVTHVPVHLELCVGLDVEAEHRRDISQGGLGLSEQQEVIEEEPHQLLPTLTL